MRAHHMVFQHGSFKDSGLLPWQLNSYGMGGEGRREAETEMQSCILFNDLAMRSYQCHFSSILFIRNELLSPAHIQGEEN